MRGAALRPSTTINDSGVDFRSNLSPNWLTKSWSINCVEAPLSIIAEACFQDSNLMATGITIGSPHRRSAVASPVKPNPWVLRFVAGKESTRRHSGFSIRSRISCAILSPILIWKVVLEWLINRIFTDPRLSESITPAPISNSLTDNPDLGAILAYRFPGMFIVMAMPASTSFRVLGGMIASSDAYKS